MIRHGDLKQAAEMLEREVSPIIFGELNGGAAKGAAALGRRDIDAECCLCHAGIEGACAGPRLTVIESGNDKSGTGKAAERCGALHSSADDSAVCFVNSNRSVTICKGSCIS